MPKCFHEKTNADSTTGLRTIPVLRPTFSRSFQTNQIRAPFVSETPSILTKQSVTMSSPLSFRSEFRPHEGPRLHEQFLHRRRGGRPEDRRLRPGLQAAHLVRQRRPGDPPEHENYRFSAPDDHPETGPGVHRAVKMRLHGLPDGRHLPVGPLCVPAGAAAIPPGGLEYRGKLSPRDTFYALDDVNKAPRLLIYHQR
jgi:hypothetical protein